MYVASDQRITCRICGYKMDETPEEIAPPSPQPQREPVKTLKQRYGETYQILHGGDIDTWTRAMYHTAMDYVHQDKPEAAIRAFKRVLEQQHDFLDAHLWLARLSDDPESKSEHYGAVVVQMPNHLESIRELMVLKGDLTRDEADKSLHSDEPHVVALDMPVEAESVALKCPVCGGALTKGRDGITVCGYCGYRDDTPARQDTGIRSVTMALLKRRGQTIQWQVGKRLLHCDNCGAERILTPQKLTARCPFCGGADVLERDALQSFVQPDGIVPFGITHEEEARERLEETLKNPLERVAGWFINNRVASKTLVRAYLPFWFFDATVQVTRTSQDPYAKLMTRSKRATATRREEFNDGVFDLPFPAFSSPEPRLAERVGRYDMQTALAYSPTLLAGCEAELYTIDFEKASILVRPRVTEYVRQRFNHNPHGDSPITVSCSVQTMQFRLVMLPVWVATLNEVDGDVRLGLVHGQTGRVVLGRAFRLKE